MDGGPWGLGLTEGLDKRKEYLLEYKGFVSTLLRIQDLQSIKDDSIITEINRSHRSKKK